MRSTGPDPSLFLIGAVAATAGVAFGRSGSILGLAAVSGMSLLSLVNGRPKLLTQVGPEAAVDQAGEQAEQHHDHDQGEGRGPRLVVGGLHLHPGVLVLA